jgi:hypothetical protein
VLYLKGINPVGTCNKRKDVGAICNRDTYCKSGNCHLLKCVKRKPMKDGPCSEDQHQECIEKQYCSKSAGFKCKDRKCSGSCGHGYHCESNQCTFFICKKPVNGCSKI